MSNLQVNTKRIKTRIIVTYLFIGIAFGACFPVGAIVMESIVKGMALSMTTIGEMHNLNPLLYMIDSAPLFLGLFAMIGGISKAKAEVARLEMSKMIEEMQEQEVENNNLLEEVRAINENNQELVSHMIDTSTTLHDNSTELHCTMRDLHNLDLQIDTTIQDMDSHVEEMDAINNTLLEQFKNYTDSIAKMYASSNAAKGEIDAHLKAVDELTGIITTTKYILSRLTDETKEVEAVISLISDISGKIKLLALNASIESARAGEAGKGFAVVANEIKILSEQTDDATEHIAETIQSVTSGVRDIGVRMDRMDAEGQMLQVSNEKVSTEFKGIMEQVEGVRQISEIAMEQMSEQNKTLASVTGQIHDVARLVDEREEKMVKSEKALTVNEEQIELLNSYTG